MNFYNGNRSFKKNVKFGEKKISIYYYYII